MTEPRPRVTVTIDELVVERDGDVEDAVRAELEAQPAVVDAGRVASAVAAAVARETGA